MRFVFVVQGEGRGHLTQALTLENMLIRAGHSVDMVMVGTSQQRELPAFFLKGIQAPIERFESFNFAMSADGKRPSMWRSVLRGVLRLPVFLASIRQIKRRLKACQPDVVVNFYEALGSVGFALSGSKARMIGIAHQFLMLHKDFELPPKTSQSGLVGLSMLTKFIAKPCNKLLALSFRDMKSQGKIRVVPPLLRKEVLDTRKENEDLPRENYILGYILNSGFSDEISSWHKIHPHIGLHFFWDNPEHKGEYKVDNTLTYYYINDKEFINQMKNCSAYCSTAGFESICEAMYMGKPLMMVPSHIEQECNAFDATKYKAAVSANKFDLDILLDFINNEYVEDISFPIWVRSAESVILKELTNF